MKVNKIKNGLDVLIYCNSVLLNKLRWLRSCISTLKVYKSYFERDKKQLSKTIAELKDIIDAIAKELRKEKKVESLISKLDVGIHSVLKEDLQQMLEKISSLQSIVDDLNEDLSYSKLITSLESFDKIAPEIEKILQKELYQEKLLQEVLDDIRRLWEERFKGKNGWLYHATSVIFLPFIQQRGLTNEELPKKIKDSIEIMSRILTKYKINQGGRLDLDVDLSQKKVSYSWNKDDIRIIAVADNLPAFMYELLNEEHLRRNYDIDRILARMTPKERSICQELWHFGAMLRRKNQVVLLHISINSDFLRYLHLPDFINDYDTFFSYIKNKMDFGSLFISLENRKAALSELCEGFKQPFSYFFKYVSAAPVIRLDEKVPPKFIFLEVETVMGRKLINIAEWKREMASVTV